MRAMRWRSLVICLLAGLLLLPALGHAQAEDPPDGPKRIFRDDFIENLVGSWKLTRKIRGTQVENSVEAQWVLNHQFLQIHMKDLANPPTYEALVLMGYAHADQKYVAHWCDTFGGKYSGVGYGKRTGDSIVFEFKDGDSSFFNTFTWEPKTQVWTFKMENVGKDGQRVPFAEDTLRRK